MGSRGDNKQSYALYEELKHLRVAPEAGTPYIYKRLDTQVHLPVEERAWQIRVPERYEDVVLLRNVVQ